MEALRIATMALVTLDILMICGIVFSVTKGWEFRPKFSLDMTRPKKKTLTLRDEVFKKRWEGIVSRANPESLESMKLAIIDADKMVDDALKQLGLQGQHMADRIEQLSDDDYVTLTGLWRAHRLRNNIVHTPGFEVTVEHLERTIEDFKAFLEELQVIE